MKSVISWILVTDLTVQVLTETTSFLHLLLANEPHLYVVGVLGERVALPCDMTPNTADDEVSLVLWYKDD
ncbi:hypothetical protein HPB48_001642 [Haemaphysalis longicornis]|uniref:Uncharacterized protein n=1 Tax=Haemaphysalis longicornis TaxID=44386 RepID=A0A9J6FMU4_HAELO|nr:hypothetical protein HPB48_001642 [Haemaphysalis longicornis]